MVPRLDADATPGCGGATRTRRRSSRTPTSSTRTARRGSARPSTSCSTPASSTTTATGTSRSTTRRPAPDDICIRLRVAQRRPRGRATLHVLPTLWFRNTLVVGGPARRSRELRAARGRPRGRDEERLGRDGAASATATPRAARLRQRDQRRPALRRRRGRAYPKDGINDHVVGGAATVSPGGTGHQGRALVPARGARRAPRASCGCACAGRRRRRPGRGWDEVDGRPRGRGRRLLRRPRARRDRRTRRRVMRQAFAGMLWSKQFYNYDVARWLDGDPAQPPPAARPRGAGRNHEWRHLHAFDVISMPDKWEYPWFAAWDLAFHCVALAHVDPEFAKEQLVLMCREWFMHPNGAIPAYEWAFDDVNPPVHAWAALRVFAIDGVARPAVPRAHLPEAAAQLHVVGQPQGRGRRLPLRGRLPRPGQHRPVRPLGAAAARRAPRAGGRHRAGWRIFALNMLEIALVLAAEDPAVRGHGDQVPRALRASSREAIATQGLWDEEDGFFYDRLRGPPTAPSLPVRVRSMVGPASRSARSPSVTARCAPCRDLWPSASRRRSTERPRRCAASVRLRAGGAGRLVVGARRGPPAAGPVQRLLDESEFLSPYGLRALSRCLPRPPVPPRAWTGVRSATHRLRAGRVDDRHVRRQLQLARADLVPGQLPRRSRRSTATRASSATTLTVEYPTGSGRRAHAHGGRRRPAPPARSRSSCVDEDGRRPCFGGSTRFRHDPPWRDNAAVPRVLPRRHRRGPRRLAPDRAGRGSWPT